MQSSEPLTQSQAARIEQALRTHSVEELSALLWKLRRRLSVDSPPMQIVQMAQELGLLVSSPDAPLRLTALGEKVSDSLTEYVYWIQRGRRHHASLEVDALRTERLAGKRVLEIGCGAGVNLLSLQRCADVVGVDVELMYLSFSQILARTENVPTPRLVCGRSERLPFEDASFDVVLFPGSLPYMHIERALREAARVLRAGGRLIAVQSDFHQTLAIRARQRNGSPRSPRRFLSELRGSVGMLVYPWVGRLLLEAFAPIHVTRRRTSHWLADAGLELNARETCVVGDELCFVAEKPPVHSK